jgi:hypothetical protein
MILKGSQRGGGGQLAAHLMNDRDNDHVTVHELRGFVAGDLTGALEEAHAISKGTRCKQFMFSLSLNPPKDAEVGVATLIDAADRAEAALGLGGQPRALIIHEKNGRRHAHVVWSRIDANELKAVNLPHFKNRLRDLSKELYLEHGWTLPEGHRENGWKNPLNFTLAEWQQAKRLDLDPREIRLLFRDAWQRSDNQASFKHALEEHGYFLARGDRRGFVALDIHGEVFAVARWTGVKTRDVREKLGDPDHLPGVDEVKATTLQRMTSQLKGFLAEHRDNQRNELQPLLDEARQTTRHHRRERTRMEIGQKQRWEKEAAQRAAKFRSGFGGAMDLLTGRAFAIRKENESEAWQAHLRDQAQRERLHQAQLKERRALQERFDTIRMRQREERMELARRIAEVWRRLDEENRFQRDPSRHRDRDMELGL